MRVAVVGATGLVGGRVSASLASRGHEVVGVSRGDGVDLSTEVVDRLAERLQGVDAVLDVTNVITQDRAEAIDFFSTVARTVSAAAQRVGASRIVLLSIIGVDGIPDDAHYAGKYAQEVAYREHAADALVVVRAAHFHDFAEMALGWGRAEDAATIPDFPVQPVDVDVVVDALVQAVTGAAPYAMLPGAVEVAGPLLERLPDLVTRLLDARGEQVRVVAAQASPELAGGACVPGPGAVLAGPSFDEWLGSQSSRGG